jgi:MoaA/NifB/PqqE/SkfB family radical SAM enzyme
MKDIRALHQPALERPLTDLCIFLTSYCNLACKMCSYWKEREHGVSYDRVLSLLEEARSLGATRFHPFGTEIFTREDTLDILSYAESIGFQEINVVSNGNLLLDEQRIERPATLRTLCISISLDGPRSYSRVYLVSME